MKSLGERKKRLIYSRFSSKFYASMGCFPTIEENEAAKIKIPLARLLNQARGLFSIFGNMAVKTR